MALTPKQQAFTESYLTCWNATKAAIDAGYSERSARKQGCRLSANVDIQAVIQERLAELKMSANEVLARLSDHACGSLAPFMQFGPEGDLLGFNLNPDQPLHLIRKATITKRRFKDGMTETTTAIELHDSQAALALLGRAHKLFFDRTEVSSDGPLYKVYMGIDIDRV